MPWTWFVKAGGGDVEVELTVGNKKEAFAGLARLQRGAGSWIDIVLDVARTSGPRSADLPYITAAATDDAFAFGVRAISASSRASAPVYITVRQAGAIVPAELNSKVNNGKGTPASPYSPVKLMDAPAATRQNDFDVDDFGILVI